MTASPMPPLRIVFFGTAALATYSLSALATEPNLLVVAVVTQPDRPKGRELKAQPSSVKVEAVRRGLTVLQPARARDPEFITALAALAPDVVVVAAYGQILPPAILQVPKFGCINVHASILPKYRGAAPIQWALLDDEPTTGVTIMRMDAGLDTGDILTQQRLDITPVDDAQSLHDKLGELGASLLLETLPDYVRGAIVPQKQPEIGVSYARKIVKEDGLLDWNLPARVLWNRVRAYTPWPGAWTRVVDDLRQSRLKIWRAEVSPTTLNSAGSILRADRTGLVVACGEGALRILELQREGGRRLNAQEFLAGFPLAVGQKLA